MTVDEAIKHAEEVVIQQIEKANALDNIPLFGMSKNDIEEIKECYKCSKEHEQLAEWLKELKQLREQTRWIPVSEGLPIELESVLAYDGTDMFVAWYFGKKWSSSDSQLEEYTPILAWMPLPEPYKAESED